MNQDTIPPLTPLDLIACGNQIQMMKAFVPYLHQKSQKGFAVILKLMEIQNLLTFYNGEQDIEAAELRDTALSPLEVLKEISNYAFPVDQERLNQSVKIFETMELMQTFQNAGDSDALLKSFLTPEQQELFETYQNTDFS